MTMTTKKHKEQVVYPRHSYINTPLTEYGKIIDQYWEEFDQILEDDKSNIMVDIDPRAVETIRNLKKIEKWKSNLFILYIHFGKPEKLAKELNINPPSLRAYLSNIRREIRC